VSADIAPAVVVLTVDQLRAVLREELAELQPVAPVAEVLDTEAACAFLGVSRATLHRAVKSGAIRQHKLLDSPRFLRSELIEDLRGGR
jgi:predicted DNA-binding protein (UPF0251 family)